jgi:hypothetical protein
MISTGHPNCTYHCSFPPSSWSSARCYQLWYLAGARILFHSKGNAGQIMATCTKLLSHWEFSDNYGCYLFMLIDYIMTY